MPTEYLQDYSPIRSISVSADTRYLSIAGKAGFAHLSTNSGRWRVLETFESSSDVPVTPGDIPHVRGGMCWFGNVLLVGADFGDSHQVLNKNLNLNDSLGSSLPPQRNKYEPDLMAPPWDIWLIDFVDVSYRWFSARILSRQYPISFSRRSFYGQRWLPISSKTGTIWPNQFSRDHPFANEG